MDQFYWYRYCVIVTGVDAAAISCTICNEIFKILKQLGCNSVISVRLKLYNNKYVYQIDIINVISLYLMKDISC